MNKRQRKKAIWFIKRGRKMTLGDHYVKMFCSDFIPDGWYKLYNSLNENEKSFVCKYLILKTQRTQRAKFLTRLRYLFTGVIK